MTIKIKNSSDNEIELHLSSKFNEKYSITEWEGFDDTHSIEIIESVKGAVDKVIKSNNIITPDDELISQFNSQKIDIIEEESSGIEHTEEKVNDFEPYPYNPDLIRVDPKPYNVNLVQELIENGEIDLAPDFQRHFVWNSKEQRSRLIESMMLRIPLPVFYLAQDKEGKFQVVDGLQRLTVINQFLKNEFKLTKLEYLSECNGKFFKQDEIEKNIAPKYARRITQTQLIFNIIDPQTPTRVKYDIFKRINQGGKPLKAQEIRNCMASKKARNLIKIMTDSDNFKKATDFSVNPTRMEDQELVLRFIGFYFSEILYKKSFIYKGNIDVFLDDTLEKLNNENEDVYNKLSTNFTNSMLVCEYLFGKIAFRKITKEHLKANAKRSLLNKSLFTSWSVVLSQFDFEKIKSLNLPQSLNIPLAEEIEFNQDYYDSLTTGTNDLSKINVSFNTAKNLVKNHLKK